MKAINKLIGKKVIIRSYGAGVFFGTLNEVEKTEDKWTAVGCGTGMVRALSHSWLWKEQRNHTTVSLLLQSRLSL